MYKAFISYSHQDESFARWLHRSLEKYRLPKALAVKHQVQRPIFPVFRDQEELATSANLSSSIKTALEQSEALIVVCSEASAASRWVNEEVAYFLSLGRAQQVFCVLHSGAVPDVFPQALATVEPLAADFRKEAIASHGRKDSLLRLIAGLLALGLDDLRRREAQARQRRLLAVAAGAVVITVVTSSLAVLAYLGQQRAERQARVSEEVSAFLTSLFEVSDPAVAQGRTFTLREMLARGAARIDGQFAADPLVGAQLAVTMGNVYGNLGDASASITLYEQARDVYGVQLGANDSRYASVLRHLGHQQFAAGELETAERTLRNALRVHESADGKDSLEVAADQSLLATIEFQRGDRDSIAGRYEEALRIREATLGEDHPDTAESLIRLGWYRLSRRQYVAAEPLLVRALRIRQRVLGERHFFTSDAMDKLGRLYEETDRLEAARALYEQSLTVKRLVLEPPHPQLVESLVNLASLSRVTGNTERALKLAREAVTMGEGVLGPMHSDLARGLNQQEMALQELGDFRGALSVARRVVAIYEGTFGAEHELVAQALNNVGALLAESLGQPEAAESPLRRAVEIFDRASSSVGWRTLARWSLANSLREQGKLTQAEAMYQEAMQLAGYGEAFPVAGFPPYEDLEADYQRLQSLLAD